MPKPTAAARNPPPHAITAPRDINPLAVTRFGPIREAVSAPLAASIASLKKFVAIWMHSAPIKVHTASHGFHVPSNFHASTQPAHTGTIAAGKVFGRVAVRRARVIFC